MSTHDLANKPALPEGWSAARVADVIAHYQTQSEDEAVAEDEAVLSDPGQTVMVIPTGLVPAVRELLGRIPFVQRDVIRSDLQYVRRRGHAQHSDLQGPRRAIE